MNELQKILEDCKIDQIHKNTLSGLKNISDHLGIWDNYSDEEKYKLENLTYKDSNLNKHFQYNGEYDSNLNYNEITRNGINILIHKISKYKDITNKDVFVDIGSGCGKLVLHVGVKLDFKTIVGIEIVEIRHKYSNHIKDQVDLGDRSVFFINKNILDFDLSIASIVFINNTCFDDVLVDEVWEKIPKGCHVIIGKEMNCKILKEKFKLDVSWTKNGYDFYYYIK